MQLQQFRVVFWCVQPSEALYSKLCPSFCAEARLLYLWYILCSGIAWHDLLLEADCNAVVLSGVLNHWHLIQRTGSLL